MDSRYGLSLRHLSVFGVSSATATPAAVTANITARRDHIRLSRLSGGDRNSATASTSIAAPNASQPARERVRTSDAATIVAPATPAAKRAQLLARNVT